MNVKFANSNGVVFLRSIEFLNYCDYAEQSQTQIWRMASFCANISIFHVHVSNTERYLSQTAYVIQTISQIQYIVKTVAVAFM